jgi:hypothetical protein
MTKGTDLRCKDYADVFRSFVNRGGFPLSVQGDSVQLSFPDEDAVQAWDLARWHFERDVVNLVVWCDPEFSRDLVKDICGLAVWYDSLSTLLWEQATSRESVTLHDVANMSLVPRVIAMDGSNALAEHLLSLLREQRFSAARQVNLPELACELEAWSSILRRAALSWRVWVFLNIRRLFRRRKLR